MASDKQVLSLSSGINTFLLEWVGNQSNKCKMKVIYLYTMFMNISMKDVAERCALLYVVLQGKLTTA